MPTIEDSSCPSCGKGPGCLSLTVVLAAKDVTKTSLAGVQMKVSAYEAPRLDCSSCGLSVVGKFDSDGRHVTFRPEDVTHVK